jgi:membrane-associated phospholipid phosphatase
MPGGSFSDRLIGRLRSCWRLKVQLSIALLILFDVPYFLIGHYPVFPVHTLPLSAIDRAIGFHPRGWVWVYQSFYLLLNIIPWLARERWELQRYLRGFVIVSVVSFACFVIFPIRGPQPEVHDAGGMYWLLRQYDVTLNSLPSLHAGLLVYTVCFSRRIGLLRVFVVIWCMLVLYATLATKEHYLVDIVAGAVLALLADAWIWRDQVSTMAAAASQNNLSRSESIVAGRR